MINIDIIKMEKNHIPSVAKIESEVFSAPWSEQAFYDTLSLEYAHFFVAVEKEAVAGYCGIYLAADEGEITNVAVASGWRRQKIAQRLLQKVMEEAHGRGIKRIFLEVRSRNEPAVCLYHKNGFESVGIRKNYYQNPQDDALVMMLRISNS